MGTHTCIVSRAGSNASDTSTAVAFAWQVGAGTGTNPVNATDFPGNAYPSGTGTIAAGAPSATITFQSNPDTTFEPDETGALTVTTSQSGVTIIGSPQSFTVANDDADPGNGTAPIYGPTATTDTGPVNGGQTGYRMETVLYDTAYVIDVLGDTDTGRPGYRFKPVGSNATNLTGYTVAADGTEQIYALQENMAIDKTTAGVPAIVEVTAAGAVKITVNGKVIKGQYQNEDYISPRGTLSASPPWLRMRTGSTTPRTVTVTKL
jgi:hypothetical protein